MPLFEYQCPLCEDTVEEVRPYHKRDRDRPRCEKCEDHLMVRVRHVRTAFALKGNGWPSKDGRQ